MKKKGIPTMYGGACFRSRLEAKWARFFDLVEWPWQYEPIDLNGYIPDFILSFAHAPMLVEVKPALYLPDMQAFTSKIERSGWEHEAVVIGSYPMKCTYGDPVLGLLGERIPPIPPGEDDFLIGEVMPSGDCPVEEKTDWWWSEGKLHHCTKCDNISFHHNDCHWRCRVNGCYAGNAHLGTLPPSIIDGLWRAAGNATQWRGAMAL